VATARRRAGAFLQADFLLFPKEERSGLFYYWFEKPELLMGMGPGKGATVFSSDVRMILRLMAQGIF
jgi:hypothetical protein